MKRASFLALLCAAAAAGAEELPRTDPSTWSNRGYLQFRWGMGPGDVDAVLSGTDAQLKTVDRLAETKDDYSPAQQNYVAVIFGFQIGGYDVRRVLFGFDRGRLFHIELNPFVHQSVAWDGWKAWYEKLDGLLTQKYGKPEKPHRRGSLMSVWLAPGRVLIRLSASEYDCGLLYADSAVERLAIERRKRERKAAIKPDLEKL